MICSSYHQTCFLGLKYHRNAIVAGTVPGPPGQLIAILNPQVGFGGHFAVGRGSEEATERENCEYKNKGGETKGTIYCLAPFHKILSLPLDGSKPTVNTCSADDEAAKIADEDKT